MECSVEVLPVVGEEREELGTGVGAGVEATFTGLLAEVAGVERVSVDSHFFHDLGADSMVMARLAPGQEAGDLPSVSIRDIYQYPTRRLGWAASSS